MKDIKPPLYKMDRLGWLAAVVLASLAMSVSAYSQDSSDLFLKAFQSFQAGEKFEREVKQREALEKYRQAEQLLQQIAKDASDWQPLVVEYRLKKTQENITRLQEIVANLPPEELPIEGALPEADKDRPAGPAIAVAPEVSVAPPAGGSRRSSTGSRSVITQEPPSRSGTGGSTLAELRRQVAQLQKENSDLNERYIKKSAELQSARVQIDKTMVTVVELKSQLAQLNNEMDFLKKDGNSIAEIREQYAKRAAGIFKELEDARADNEVLQEENDRLMNKLDIASKYILDSDSIRKTLLTERKELVDARKTAEARTKKIKDNSGELERVSQENKELKAQIATSKETTVSKEEYDKLLTENKTLTKKLASAEKDTASKEDLKKLADEKAALESRIAEAEKNFKEAASPEKDKVVSSLQSELNSVNDKLIETQSQLSRSDEVIKDLQKQLDETSGQLAEKTLNPTPGREEKALASENELLRGIILRQIKEQSQRDEARKALEQEVATLQIKSDVINQQLAVLGAPVLQLTPEERALFKEPVALLSESGTNQVEVTMAVSLPKSGDALAGGDAGISQGEEAVQPSDGADTLPEDVREQVQQAKELFELKNFADAEKIYQDIVEKVPGNYFVLSNLGAVQIEGGKLSAAEVALKKAIQINGQESYPWTNLGIIYCRQGKFDEAIGALRQAIALNELDWRAHNYLGISLGQNSQRDEAEVELKKSLELNDKYPDAHFNLAIVYATMPPQDLALAKQHYEQAISLGAAPDPALERLIQ